MNKRVDSEIEQVREAIDYRLTLTFPTGVPTEQKWPIILDIYDTDYKKVGIDKETFGSILYVLRERGVVGAASRWCDQDDFIDSEYYGYADKFPDFFVFLEEKPSPRADETPIEVPISREIMYRVTFENHKVMLNGHQLREPQFDSLNYRLIEFLLQHPNQKLSKPQVEEGIHQPLARKMPDLITDLGFKKDVRKMFFQVSKDSIMFKNPIYADDFKRMGLKQVDLEAYAKGIRGEEVGNKWKPATKSRNK